MKTRRGNGEGSVWPTSKAGYTWGIESPPLQDGKTKQRFLKVRTKTEARKILNEWVQTLITDPLASNASEPGTIGELLDAWVTYKDGKIDRGTLDSYRDLITLHIKPVIGNLQLRELTSVEPLQKLIDSKAKGADKLSASRVRHMRSVISGVLKLAIKYKRLRPNQNFALELELPKLPDAKANIHPYSLEEAQQLQAFLARTRNHWELYINLLLMTGMRRGEALGLRWEDVTLDGPAPSIEIKQNLRFTSWSGIYAKLPKNGKTRVIGIPPQLAALLRKTVRHLGTTPFGNLVFRTRDGKAISPAFVTHMWPRVCKAAGVRQVRLHDLRHSFATIVRAKSQGKVDIKQLQIQMGHADIRTTMNVYGHVKAEELQEVAAAVGDVFAS